MRLPTPIYDAVPYVYGASSIATFLSNLQGILPFISGVLFGICAYKVFQYRYWW